MTTIYIMASNENFENATLIRRESINNVKGFSVTDRVKVRGAWDYADEFKEMGREDFLDLVSKGGAYAYQNINEELNGLMALFGIENNPSVYIQKANIL